MGPTLNVFLEHAIQIEDISFLNMHLRSKDRRHQALGVTIKLVLCLRCCFACVPLGYEHLLHLGRLSLGLPPTTTIPMVRGWPGGHLVQQRWDQPQLRVEEVHGHRYRGFLLYRHVCMLQGVSLKSTPIKSPALYEI